MRRHTWPILRLVPSFRTQRHAIRFLQKIIHCKPVLLLLTHCITLHHHHHHHHHHHFLLLLLLLSEANPYLFNGDFVDRGSWSVEVIMTMFGFRILYPNHFHVRRHKQIMIKKKKSRSCGRKEGRKSVKPVSEKERGKRRGKKEKEERKKGECRGQEQEITEILRACSSREAQLVDATRVRIQKPGLIPSIIHPSVHPFFQYCPCTP